MLSGGVGREGMREGRVRAPVSAERLPHDCLAAVFRFLPLADIAACQPVCRHWAAYLHNEDCGTWEGLSGREVAATALGDGALLVAVVSHKGRLRAARHAWNPLDCSRNMFVKPNGFTVHRQPVAQSTDGVRGKRGFNCGRHAWELCWDGPLGTVAVVGIATKHAALQCGGYVSLLGSDDQSWAWNLVDNTLLHDAKTTGQFPPANNAPKYQAGERIRCVLDCDDHLLYFERGDEFLGVAFRQLPPVKLFPAVCAVYGNTHVSMVYLGPPLDG